jgi:tellurite resistance protein TehA-like permease
MAPQPPQVPPPPTPFVSFCWGMFGSALPEVLRLYKLAVAGQPQPEFRWYYIVMSCVFIVFAGIFTVAWKPENPFKAIWVGVSFPVLISTMIQNAPSLH